MVEPGPIASSEDPNDCRLKQISPTEPGDVNLKDGIQAGLIWLEDLGKRLSEDEQVQVIAALNLLLEKAE